MDHDWPNWWMQSETLAWQSTYKRWVMTVVDVSSQLQNSSVLLKRVYPTPARCYLKDSEETV